MSADAELKSFVDRIIRVQADTGIKLGRAIEGRLERLEYTLVPLSKIDIHSTVAADRACTAAGRLLGAKTDTIRHRAKLVARRGGFEAAMAYMEGWFVGEVWGVPALDYDFVGFVYAMEAIDFPGVVKIGFSRSPRQRLQQLEQRHKISLRLIFQTPATEFDEHLIQHHLEPSRMANEWFDLGGHLLLGKPSFRFFTPDRMWNEIKEAA